MGKPVGVRVPPLALLFADKDLRILMQVGRVMLHPIRGRFWVCIGVASMVSRHHAAYPNRSFHHSLRDVRAPVVAEPFENVAFAHLSHRFCVRLISEFKSHQKYSFATASDHNVGKEIVQ